MAVLRSEQVATGGGVWVEGVVVMVDIEEEGEQGERLGWCSGLFLQWWWWCHGGGRGVQEGLLSCVVLSANCRGLEGLGKKKSCAVDVWYDPKDEMNQMIIKHGLFQTI